MNASELVAPDVLDLDLLGGAAAYVCALFTGRGSLQELARRMHWLAPGRPGRFQAFDCGWAEPMLEELLDHALRPGSSGTVFLEHVDRLSPRLQQRLLEILDGQAGPGGTHKASARVMASTSESLVQRVVEGTFNELLFYRLNAIHLMVPPALGES